MNTTGPNTPVVSHRNWTRRDFAKALGFAVAGGSLPWLGGCAGRPEPGPQRKKVALLATEIRKYSHAQHFVDRLLEGYGWEGAYHHPPLELAGLYVDQFPEGDLTRDRVQRHQVKLYPTVEEALTLGGSSLGVDGVLIIGEHGDYPRNEKGQKLYPRYDWFKKVVGVFEESGRAVPVFNDKHLATRWDHALEMVQDSRRLGFAFLAGSSLPVTWRLPSIDLPWGTPLRESVCACYGGVDSYDFHGLETAQCMSERRAGGERGIRSIVAIEGPDVWNAVRKRDQTRDLLLAALSRSHTLKAPAGFTIPVVDLDWIEAQCPKPVAYFMEHRDGFQSVMFLLNRLILDFNYAGLQEDGTIVSTQFYLPMPPRLTTLADFFNPLMHHIETCVQQQRAPYPVERTLLTTGMTAFGVESLFRKEKITTPEMSVRYEAPRASHYWRS